MASAAHQDQTTGRRESAPPLDASDECVGVGVIVVRGDDVLFELRRGAHGAGTWSFPGGHVDDGESAEACALRELEEETGLRGINPRRVGDVLCQGTRLCEPCQYLADLTGTPLLRPLVHCGGLRADIVRGGVIRIGDRVRLVDEEQR